MKVPSYGTLVGEVAPKEFSVLSVFTIIIFIINIIIIIIIIIITNCLCPPTSLKQHLILSADQIPNSSNAFFSLFFIGGRSINR